MKTVSGNCVSSKQTSLSKAAKILSKFVSVDNGASQVTSAYLHRASAAFDELNQLHKELKLPHSHKKKHKGHKTEETHDDSGKVAENFGRSFETNLNLNNGYVQSKNEFSRQQLGNENADEDGEKSTQSVVKLSQELNGSIGYDVGNGGNEKHKKNKRKREIESRHDGNTSVKLTEGKGEGNQSVNVQNETASSPEHEGGDNMRMEEEKKQKKEKKKEDKINVPNGTESSREQGNEGDDNMGMEGGKKLKKDKKKDKEGTGDMTKKRMKRKREDDP